MCQISLQLKKIIIHLFLLTLLFWETRLITTKGDLSAVTYRDKILQAVTIPYLHNLGLNPILQDDDANQHRVRLITAWSCTC